MATIDYPRIRSGSNPILWRELLYFRRVAQRWQRHESIIVLVLTVVALAVSAYLLDFNHFRLNNGLLTVIMMLWIFHAMVSIRAIIAGAGAVSREHIGMTWDTLVLTGISARRILSGKLRAALLSVMPWMLGFGVLRLLTLPLMSLSLTSTYAYYQCYVRSSTTFCDSAAITWIPWAWILAVVLTVLLTVLEVLSCVALGMVGSALTRRSITAAVLALCIRFAPVAIFAGFARYRLGNTWFWQYWSFTPFTLADGGTVGLMQLAFPLISWTRGDHVGALPGLLGVTVLLLVILVGSLLLTLVALKRGGALTERQLVGGEQVPSVSAPA
ncbi:MAG: hypothetical protein KF726_10865 [Anaerolineae bacterium]|nr:hypothetical protein [Anaerolineae bacterium]